MIVLTKSVKMECSGQVNFKDHEYQMEEALHKTRRQLIAMLEEDECLQCLRASHCNCPVSFHPLQVYQYYQLFDYGPYQVFQAPPPASQVPKPYWIHGNWAPNNLAHSWMKVKAENLDKSWENAKASTDMILTKDSKEAAKTAFVNKIYSWFDAPDKKVQLKTKEDIKASKELTPVWPPIKQSPWYQKAEKNKATKKEVSNSVADFFQKFAAPNLALVRPDKPAQTTFLPVLRPIVATRMNIAYNGLPVTGSNMSAIALKMNYAM